MGCSALLASLHLGDRLLPLKEIKMVTIADATLSRKHVHWWLDNIITGLPAVHALSKTDQKNSSSHPPPSPHLALSTARTCGLETQHLRTLHPEPSSSSNPPLPLTPCSPPPPAAAPSPQPPPPRPAAAAAAAAASAAAARSQKTLRPRYRSRARRTGRRRQKSSPGGRRSGCRRGCSWGLP
jgi:hypothetical protein